MSFDGVFTHAMVNELRETLLSGRISKIHQPYENEIVLVIRSRGKTIDYYYLRTLVMLVYRLPKSIIRILIIRLTS